MAIKLSKLRKAHRLTTFLITIKTPNNSCIKVDPVPPTAPVRTVSGNAPRRRTVLTCVTLMVSETCGPLTTPSTTSTELVCTQW